MASAPGRIPELVAGDRLTREEFERRYEAMPHLKKAELVEGVVYVGSPVNHGRHGRPHALLCGWVVNYVAKVPEVDCGIESTVRLDLDNEPQPDLMLRVPERLGGCSRIGPAQYVEGAPELVAEVAASSASYDLHDKLRAYRRNGVLEYVVWRVDDGELDWFVLRGGRYDRLEGADGVSKSLAFPGLWLDVKALLAGDLATVLAVLERGLVSDECVAFRQRLRREG